MNWFGFGPERSGTVIEVVGRGATGATDPASATSPAGPAGVADALVASLGATGRLAPDLLAHVEPALAEIARRHAGRLRVVDAVPVAPGAADACAVVIVVERQPDPTISACEIARRFGLTDRQGAVALLLARRLSNVEIARHLDVSPHTARHHTERVLERLGITSRMAVAGLVLGMDG